MYSCQQTVATWTWHHTNPLALHAHVCQEGQGTLENCIWKKGFESEKLSEQKVENRQHIVNGACIHKPCFVLISKSSVRVSRKSTTQGAPRWDRSYCSRGKSTFNTMKQKKIQPGHCCQNVHKWPCLHPWSASYSYSTFPLLTIWELVSSKISLTRSRASQRGQ